MQRSNIRWEALCCALIFALAYGVDAYLCSTQLLPRGVWRRAAQPAVMVALGHGFCAPQPGAAPAIDAFIAGKARTLDPTTLPSEIPLGRVDTNQQNWEYLLRSVGLYWRVAGISWDNLGPFFALFYALSALAAYGLFRLAARRSVALGIALIWVLSPVQLLESASFRDYSKAPFQFAIFFAFVLLVKHAQTPRRLLAWGAALGILIGAGVAFRFDLVLCIPPALGILLLATPGDLRETWRPRLAACGLLLVLFVALFLGQKQAATADQADHIHLGMGVPFNQVLGIGGAPYDFAYVYADNEAYAAHVSYGARVLHTPSPFRNSDDPDYRRASWAWLSEVLWTFPADQLLRSYAAVLRCLDTLPFEDNGVYKPHPSAEVPAIRALHAWRWTFFGLLYGIGRYIALIALLLLTARSLRYGLCAFLGLLYFTGYTGLQYDVRHAFHNEIFFWWLLALVLSVGTEAVQRMRGEGLRVDAWIGAPRRVVARRVAVSVVAGALLLVVPLYALRAYQSAKVGALYAAYAKAPWTPVRTKLESANPPAARDKWQGSIIYRIGDIYTDPSCTPPSDAYTLQNDYLAIELVGKGEPVSVALEYQPGINREFVVPAGGPNGGSTFIYTPIYDIKTTKSWDSQFAGVVVRGEDQAHVKGFYRLADPTALHFWPTLVLTPDVESQPRYQRITEVVPPYVARRAAASGENLYPQGNFETWTPAGDAPLGFTPPRQTSAIAPEKVEVVEGKTACRQTVIAPDPPAFGGQFGALIPGLEFNTTYELHVRAKNLAPAAFTLSAFAISRAGQPTVLERLAGEMIEIRPNAAYQDLAGQFTTGKVDGLAVYVTAAYTGQQFPAVIVWDDWRLIKIGPGTK